MSQANERGARSPEEFCKWAGIGLTTFYAEVKAGRLKTKLVGRRRLVPDESGREWLASLPDASGPVKAEAA